MQLRKSVLIFILSISLLNITIAQSNIEHIDSLAGRFIKNLRKDYSEKILVQTNKSVFVAGEELWMKAWVINNLSHKFYKHSQTLYADIVNDKDLVIAQVLLNLPSEKTEANLKIAASTHEGYYWLRLYTANMIKNDTTSIMVVPLYVINSKYPIANAENIIANKLSLQKEIITNHVPNLQLFPEGGSIIAGTNTVIGIKATDENGNPLGLEGYISDSKDNTIETWFTTDAKNGLAKSSFFVSKSHKYLANVKVNNKVVSWPLPEVNHYTSQIAIKDESPNYIKAIISQGDSIYKKGGITYLLGISRDSICFASEGKDMYEVNIPKASFPTGMSKLLLFNEKKEVISERAIYINKEKEELFISTNKPFYGIRDHVIANIMSGDTLVHPTLAALSVTVTDDSLVTDEIGYYTNVTIDNFDSSTTVRQLQLLTQPFKFIGQVYSKSNEMDKEAYQKLVLPTDTTITDIKGKIINKKGILMPNRLVTIYAKGKINLFDSDTTNSLGEFKFRLPTIVDSIPFTLQVSTLKGAKLDEKIVMEANSPFPIVATPISLKQKHSVEKIGALKEKANLDNFVFGTGREWLQSVTVKTSIKSNSYNTSKRVSNFSQIMTGEAMQKLGSTDASNALLTIPGLHLRAGFLTLGGVASFTVSSKDEPLLIIDGVMIGGGDGPVVEDATTADAGAIFNSSPLLAEISRIPVDMIDFVEVLKGPEAAYYGSRSTNGVIIINTHRFSNFRSKMESYGTLVYYPKSYHIAPIFAVPDYENLLIRNGKFKDLRATIYWNGHLYTSPKGKADISFYTGDAITNYTVSVLGLTSSGDIIYKKQKIKVQ
jgi:hypothetical protein